MTDRPKNGHELILAVNAGSSSLKISLYRRVSEAAPASELSHNVVSLLLDSSLSNISAPPALFTFSLASHKEGREVKKEPVDEVKDHTGAFSHFLDYLKAEASIDRSEIVYVCHRVVHGGDYFEPIVLTEESYHHIENLSDLAPLHNGGALSVIQACFSALPNARSIAYFDTSFHRPMPEHIASYAINPKIAKERGLKKYGFHGLSYAFILESVSKHIGKDSSACNLIVMHLGSGASMCAIQGGKSLDTTMGLTPLSGLPGATRSGAVDPSLIFHYTNRAGRITHDRSAAVDVHVTQAEDILNRKAGWAALTGTSDFAVVVQKMTEFGENASGGWAGNEKYKLAFDLVVDRILGYVGSYYVKLSGKVDALVFSGGIGERSVELRQEVARRVSCLGFRMDEKLNAEVDEGDWVVADVGVSKEDGHRLLICRTDEQLEMAKECALDSKFWQQTK